MGLYDVVLVPCPKCRTLTAFQTKGAMPEERAMRRFELATAPADVLSNVNRHSPHVCEVCGTSFGVDENARASIEVEPIDEGERFLNCWYHRRGVVG
jgi:hypothetical protein